MFKFFWGKGSQQSADRLKIQKELFQFQKTIQHGFPSKPTALAWDPVLRLLCIGTKAGAIKIFGAPGVEFYGQHDKDAIISHLYFIPGQGRVISLCEDNSLHLWEIVTENTPSLKRVHSQSLEGKLKKISACWVESNRENFLIGTENGNIYVMDLVKFEVTESVIYLDVVMQKFLVLYFNSVTEDFKVNPGAVETVSERPGHPDHILIGYTRGLLVLWNRKSLSAEQTFVASQQLEGASWHSSGKQFVTAHNDGSYIIWTVNQGEGDAVIKKEPATTSPYGPFPCKALSKILWSGTGENESDVIAFGGGMPRASYGDRFTVSVVKGETSHVTFDLTSKVIDFCLIAESDTKLTEALVVLAEEELIVIDLITQGWPAFSSPYLASLHCSAITAQTTVSVTSRLYDKIISHPQVLASSTKISSRPWPVNGGVPEKNSDDDSSSHLLLLTGHEDGSVRFWDASTAALHQIAKFSTAPCFSSDELDSPPDDEDGEAEEDEWPPFRKVGVFDPYSDDPRLAVKKLCLCPVTGLLSVAGTAGQVVVAELSETQKEKEIPVTLVNIVSDRDNFVWKGHDKLPVRKGSSSFKPGFQPTSILQLHPPAAATALALHADWSVLAVGTAHGLALYDTIHHREVVAKCTLNPNDMSGAGDQPMSRRKSFKKSLRESFRRLRKGRSQRPNVAPKSSPTSPITKSHEPSSSNAGPSTAAEVRPVERQIEARTTDDGMGSMVRCLFMAKTFVLSQSLNTTATLWAGTNSGAIYVFNLALPAGDKRKNDPVGAQLAKEIQLKHRAPVVSINIIDGNCASLGGSSATSNSSPSDGSAPHRVVISSEEQFKVFTLPNLRPYGKYKLTAYTGCQVRRVAVIPFTSRSDASYKENCLVCLSNQGDFHILSLPDLRRQMNAQAIKKEDIHATSTVVLTHQGEALYMLSSSEIQRVALSARDGLQIRCRIPEVSKSALPVTTHSDVSSEPTIDSGIDAGLSSSEKADVAQVADIISTIPATASTPRDGELDKSHGSSNEINNSTIVSVEPETSFGDMTVDSIKDHLVTSLEECRIIEAKTERRIQETVTVTKTSTVVTSGEIIVNAMQARYNSKKPINLIQRQGLILA
nr:EOG090X00I4 [Eurycercus lamellatus]